MPTRLEFTTGMTRQEALKEKKERCSKDNPYKYKLYNLNITGQPDGRSVTKIIIEKEEFKIKDYSLKIILRLVQESKKGKGGYINEDKLIKEGIVSGDSIRQRINQINVLFRKITQKIIISKTVRGITKRKLHRLNVYPDLISYDINNLKNSGDSKIREIANNLSTPTQ